MVDNTDALYKGSFENYIIEFCKLCNSGETTISALSNVLEHLKTSQILNYLTIDPSNPEARACVRDYISSHRNINSDFLEKFISIVSVKINIAPSSSGYINSSYSVKVKYNALPPSKKLTNITMHSRRETLRYDSKNKIEYVKSRRPFAQAIKVKMNDALLDMCVNAIADLSKTIVEGNRANGRDMNAIVKTTVTR